MLRVFREHPTLQSRVCVLIGVDPKTVWRDRPADNPEIHKKMNQIAENQRRFWYGRISVVFERTGIIMNDKKLDRNHLEEGLSVRRRRGRKRARCNRTPMPVPLRPNKRCSLSFVSDTFGACRRFHILALNDALPGRRFSSNAVRDGCREKLCLGLTMLGTGNGFRAGLCSWSDN